MADEEDLDLGNWDDEGNEGPAITVVPVAASAEVDLTLLEAKRKADEEEKRRAEEALKPKAAAPAKASRAAEGGSGAAAAAAAADSAAYANMTEAQREEAQRNAEAASSREMVSGLTAGSAAAWAPKLIIASVRDLEELGRSLAERVHAVRAGLRRGARAAGAPGLGCSLRSSQLPWRRRWPHLSRPARTPPPLPSPSPRPAAPPAQTFPTGAEALKFYTAMLAVAEQKMGTAELTTVKKRLEVGVNTAKEREAELRKKASSKKKGPNTAKVGGAIDTYEEEAYDEAPAAVSAAGGGGGAGEGEGSGTPSPFVKPKFKVEECVPCAPGTRAREGALAYTSRFSLSRSPPLAQGLYVDALFPCAAVYSRQF